MAIDIAHFKKALLAKEQDLIAEIDRFEANVKDAQSAEVEDPIDAVTSSQTKAAAAAETSMASDTLAAVRAALERIQAGNYGVCVECGRPIEPKRLEAVPWTPFCLEDQQKHDDEKPEPSAFNAAL